MFCIKCEKETSNKKYCSKICQQTCDKNGKCYDCEIPIIKHDKRCRKCHSLYKGGRPICDICSIFKTDENTTRHKNGNKVLSRCCKKCTTAIMTTDNRNLKQKFVEYKGGQCQQCGYSKCINALDFHHLDPNQKEFGIASISVSTTTNIDRFKPELDKCVLLCANCHRESHSERNRIQREDFVLMYVEAIRTKKNSFCLRRLKELDNSAVLDEFNEIMKRLEQTELDVSLHQEFNET